MAAILVVKCNVVAMVLLLILLLFILAIVFVRTWRSRGAVTVIFVMVVTGYFNAWIFTPFSVDRWRQASPYERRILARNFTHTYDYQGLTQTDIESLLGNAQNERDSWTYYVESPVFAPPLDAVILEFRNEKVASAHSLWDSHPHNLERVPDPIEIDFLSWQRANRLERAPMAFDLLKRKLLDDKLRGEVLQLLGPPDHWSSFSYDLGMSSFEIDGYSLDFEIDSHGKVIRAGVYQN